MAQPPERTALRRFGRTRRRAVPAIERASRAHALAAHARATVLRWRHHDYACFLPADGEIDTTGLIESIWRRNRRVWLPCVRGPLLRFRLYRRGMAMQRGAFGILEPSRGRLCSARDLDLVLTPLVVFDSAGQRMGMGGGFYDRTFAFLRDRTRWRQPKLFGVAFGCQEVDAVPVEHWDVPLDGMLTDEGFRRMR